VNPAQPVRGWGNRAKMAQGNYLINLGEMARPEGFEPPAA
jgi:hypothetical protein